jgi:hypothetical protein
MNCRRGSARVIVCLAAACLWVPPLFAQQEQGEKPKPAAREIPPLLDSNSDQNDKDQETQAMRPDNGPMTGVQNLTLGTPEVRHSYWVPGIGYSNIVRSNSVNSAATSAWNTTSFVTGNLSLLEAWSHSLLSVNFSGGGFTSTDPIQGNGQYHQLASAFEIEQRRWQMLVVEQFSYLPQSAYGFGGTSALATPGIMGTLAVPLPGLQSLYIPGQSVLTTNGPRYSNASAVQLTYAVSPRGSMTVAGVYGVLRFVDAGNVNSDTEILNAGYNYLISRKDTIGVVYVFSAYRFPGAPQALGDHVVQLAYGRKISGKLALRLAGGPEITMFRVPINNSSRRVSGSGRGALIYALPRGGVDLSYTHGVGGGSGVFTGSDLDQINADWSRQLSRVWKGRVNLGYAKNRQILSASGLAPLKYDTWLTGAGLSRALGRAANFSVAYQAEIQNSSVPICSSPTCGTNYTAHQVFLTIEWQSRPLMLK